MIEIETQWFIFLYLLLFLTAIFSAWVGFEIFRRRVGRRTRDRAINCPRCGMTFLPPAAGDIFPCPRCGGKIELCNPGRRFARSADKPAD